MSRCVRGVVIVLAALAFGGCAASTGKTTPPAVAVAHAGQGKQDVARLAGRIREALPDNSVTLGADSLRIVIPVARLFELDATRLSAEGSAWVDRLARVLRGCRSCDTGILVHTDTIGPAAANWVFSTGRAVALAERLEAAGVPTARLHPHGAGESESVAQNETPADRQMNRRVEFVIHP